jgi:acyl carrier protein
MGNGSGDHAIIERIKEILRRDLKLGPDAKIEDDMALAGGEFDLDSLDLLLLITSLEREFGIKVKEGSITRESFATVATLASFVQSVQRPTGA